MLNMGPYSLAMFASTTCGNSFPARLGRLPSTGHSRGPFGGRFANFLPLCDCMNNNVNRKPASPINVTWTSPCSIEEDDNSTRAEYMLDIWRVESQIHSYWMRCNTNYFRLFFFPQQFLFRVTIQQQRNGKAHINSICIIRFVCFRLLRVQGTRTRAMKHE